MAGAATDSVSGAASATMETATEATGGMASDASDMASGATDAASGAVSAMGDTARAQEASTHPAQPMRLAEPPTQLPIWRTARWRGRRMRLVAR